jgi:hypothetical protein
MNKRTKTPTMQQVKNKATRKSTPEQLQATEKTRCQTKNRSSQHIQTLDIQIPTPLIKQTMWV